MIYPQNNQEQAGNTPLSEMVLPGACHPRMFSLGDLSEITPLRERFARWVKEWEIQRDYRGAQRFIDKAEELLEIGKELVAEAEKSMNLGLLASKGIGTIVGQLNSNLEAHIEEVRGELQEKQDAAGDLANRENLVAWQRAFSEIVDSHSLDLERSMDALLQVVGQGNGLLTVDLIASELETEFSKLKHVCQIQRVETPIRSCQIMNDSVRNVCAKMGEALFKETLTESSEISKDKSIYDLADVWERGRMGIIDLCNEASCMLEELENAEKKRQKAMGCQVRDGGCLIVSEATAGAFNDFDGLLSQVADGIKAVSERFLTPNKSPDQGTIVSIGRYVKSFCEIADLELKFANLRSLESSDADKLKKDLLRISGELAPGGTK
jgi:hypothetical protein